MPRAHPRILGVSPGEPFDRLTWSGISHHLFTALDDQDALVDAVSGQAPASADLAAKALAVRPSRRRWIERYEFSRVKRGAMSLAATREINRAEANRNCILQIGAWYDLGRVRSQPAVRCSYHDGNLAQFLRHHDLVSDAGAAHIRRTVGAERRIYDELDLIMPMSDWLRRSFIEDFDQDPEKVVTVGAGANLSRIPDRVPRRDFGSPRFLVVASEFERKGGPELLEAFGSVRATHPRAELWMVGHEPPVTERLPGVRWLGRISRTDEQGDAQMEGLYERATAYVMPSRFEPFGIAFLEAMAYGLPCIGTRACAMPEIIEDRVTGLLVPTRAPGALASAMTRLADEADAARAMGEAGYRRLRERFTWERVASRMIDAIARRMGEPRTPPIAPASSVARGRQTR